MSDPLGQLTSATKLQNLIDSIFPSDQLVDAFGYGSGVFSQGQGDPGMLDMIFVVRDAQGWHQANQLKNGAHYAMWLRTMDQKGVRAAGLQRGFQQGGCYDGKVFFHVIEDPIPLKYGVIQKEDLILDLTEWDSLYVAGRLHKPTLKIPINRTPSLEEENEQMELIQARHSNLQAAAAAAMLLSPIAYQNVSWLQFYSQIAALSYTGDFRMQVGGEDPLKVQKLVQTPGQLERFHAYYRDHQDTTTNRTSSVLKVFEETGLISIGQDGIQWDPSDVSVRTQFIQRLPSRVQKDLSVIPSMNSSSQGRNINSSEQMLIQQQDILSKTLASIVAPAARTQSFKGLFTFGLRKSMRYAAAKLSKGLLRKR